MPVQIQKDFTDQIIIYRQLKSRSQNTSDGVNRAVPSAIHLLKLDQPRLCIRQANLVNALLSKRFSVQDIDYGLISRLGVMTDTGFQRSIFLYQFNYRVIAATGNDMVKQIRLNLLSFSLSESSRFLPLGVGSFLSKRQLYTFFSLPSSSIYR